MYVDISKEIKMKINAIQNSSFKGYVNNRGDMQNAIDTYRTKIAKKQEQISNEWSNALRRRQIHITELANLMDCRNSALEFDTFMRSKEVKQIVDNMPKDADINITVETDPKSGKGRYGLYSKKADKTTGTDDKYIAYCDYCQNEDNSLNKDGIIFWLNSLAEYFKIVDNTNKDNKD